MKKSKISYNILYLSFHNSLKKVYGANKIVEQKKICEKLGRQFLVNKRLRISAIKELESMNLLKDEGDGYYKILEGDFDLEENTGEFIRSVLL